MAPLTRRLAAILVGFAAANAAAASARWTPLVPAPQRPMAVAAMPGHRTLVVLDRDVVVRRDGHMVGRWPLPRGVRGDRPLDLAVGRDGHAALVTWAVGGCGDPDAKEFPCGGVIRVVRWRVGDELPEPETVIGLPGHSTRYVGTVKAVVAGDGTTSLAWSVLDYPDVPVAYGIATAPVARPMQVQLSDHPDDMLLGLQRQAGGAMATTVRAAGRRLRLYDVRIRPGQAPRERLAAVLPGAAVERFARLYRNARGDRIVTWIVDGGARTLARMAPARQRFGPAFPLGYDDSVAIGARGDVTVVLTTSRANGYYQALRVRRGTVAGGLGTAQVIARLRYPGGRAAVGADGTTTLAITGDDRRWHGVTLVARATRDAPLVPLRLRAHSCGTEAVKPYSIRFHCNQPPYGWITRWR
jgi:hypothetical protein